MIRKFNATRSITIINYIVSAVTQSGESGILEKVMEVTDTGAKVQDGFAAEQ